MPLELWSTLVGASIALVGGLATAAITAWVSVRGERRADAREARREQQESEARQRDLAAQIADSFRDHVVTIQRHADRADEQPLEIGFSEWWWQSPELELRHRVDHLTDGVLRARMQLVLDAVDDHRMQAASGRHQETYLLEIFSLGREIAMASVRGQQLESAVTKEVQRFEDLAEHANELREIERDAWNENQQTAHAGDA